MDSFKHSYGLFFTYLWIAFHIISLFNVFHIIMGNLKHSYVLFFTYLWIALDIISLFNVFHIIMDSFKHSYVLFFTHLWIALDIVMYYFSHILNICKKESLFLGSLRVIEKLI